MEMGFEGEIVTLTDEFGNDIQFEHYGSLEMDGTVYVGLIEITDDPKAKLMNNGTLFLLKTVEDDNGEELLVTIDDEDELKRVIALFEEEYEDLIVD